MATIIAGMFDTIAGVKTALRGLVDEGHFDPKDICTFFNNPPGQHGTFPVGGDEDADPGAPNAHLKAGAVGRPAAAIPAAGVGAYAGSLSGALSGQRGTEAQPVRRPAGAMVAVHVDGPVSKQAAVQTLHAAGAQWIEEAEGAWRDGEWVDFDPLTMPSFVDPPQTTFIHAGAPQSGDTKMSDTKGGRMNEVEIVVFRVSPLATGWTVTESDFGEPIATFRSRGDARKYAVSLAKTKPRAVVEVYREGGVLEASSAYSAGDGVL